MNRALIQDKEYNPYYNTYLDLLESELELIDGFVSGKTVMVNFMLSIPEDKEDYAYESGKWTIKEVLQHVIDTERIFMYRCLRIARGDATPMAGYDQDNYIEPAQTSNKSMTDIIKEYRITREYSINLLQSFNNTDLMQVGTASGSKVSARAVAFIVLGHELWHKKIIEERYF